MVVRILFGMVSDPLSREMTVSTDTVNNPLRFPGQYFDGDTGLHQNWFRDYNPYYGRYITADPIGLLYHFSDPVIQLSARHSLVISSGSRNRGLNHLYGYAFQNTVRYADLFGLFPAPWCSKWEVIICKCPDVGDDIKPEDVPKGWIDEKLKEWGNKPCGAVEKTCKSALGAGCYAAGTPCLVPC